MASGALLTYLGVGVIASRPATPDTYAGIPSFYYATDTDTLSVWDGSTWENVGGGGGTNRDIVTAVTSSAGTLTLDYSLGDYFTVALSENVTTLAFSNLPSSPAGVTISLRITQDSTPRTFAWPASFRWIGGGPGVISTGSGAIDELIMTSYNQGTTWLVVLSKAWA